MPCAINCDWHRVYKCNCFYGQYAQDCDILCSITVVAAYGCLLFFCLGPGTYMYICNHSGPAATPEVLAQARFTPHMTSRHISQTGPARGRCVCCISLGCFPLEACSAAFADLEPTLALYEGRKQAKTAHGGVIPQLRLHVPPKVRSIYGCPAGRSKGFDVAVRCHGHDQAPRRTWPWPRHP